MFDIKSIDTYSSDSPADVLSICVSVYILNDVQKMLCNITIAVAD